MNIEDFQKVLWQFAEEAPVSAELFRLEHDAPGLEQTGVLVVFGKANGKRFVRVEGIKGELPANIKIEVEDGKVFASPKAEPNNWQPLDDADALRVFSLLHPQLVARQATRVDPETTKDEKGMTVVSSHVDLFTWKPELPEDFLKWLRGDAHDRVVVAQFDGDRLVETRQPDLPPRRADTIIARFKYET